MGVVLLVGAVCYMLILPDKPNLSEPSIARLATQPADTVTKAWATDRTVKLDSTQFYAAKTEIAAVTGTPRVHRPVVQQMNDNTGPVTPAPGANWSFVCRARKSLATIDRTVRVLSFSSTKSAYFRSCALFGLAEPGWEYRLDLFAVPEGANQDLVQKRQWERLVRCRASLQTRAATSQ